MLRFTTLCLVMLWAAGAQAQAWGMDCAESPTRTVEIIGAGAHAGQLPREACYGFGETTTDSTQLIVRAASVLFCLNPDVTAVGVLGTATVNIKKCYGMSITPGANTCIDINDAALDGTVGAPGTQNACVRAGPGRYLVDVVVGGAAADELPYVSAEAEE